MGVTVGYDSLTEIEATGFCVDEWAEWNLGGCGVYALALMILRPDLRLGLLGELEADEYSDTGFFFLWQHAFAYDDTYAYDSAGRHPLPYHGVNGNFTHIEWDQYPEDFGFEDDGFDIEAAIAHIQRNGILEGCYPTGG